SPKKKVQRSTFTIGEVTPQFKTCVRISSESFPFVRASWTKATKGSLKPSNYGFDPIRPRNVMANCLTEFSRVWAYNLRMVESGDYFFFAISPNQSVTAFRSEIGQKFGWVKYQPSTN